MADCRILEKHMNESTSDSKVYEIGYLLVPSLPAEKVGEQVSAFAVILEKHSAVVIGEESPTLIPLAYEMEKRDHGYFGWIKFYCSPSVIEDIRKSFDQNPNTLRTLAIATVKEKTYLGKRAKSDNKAEEKPIQTVSPDETKPSSEGAVAVPTAPMTAAEIVAVDKSIDDMVKGA
jgi:ribosomal protein S6